jgi:SAM-dependent methyltransferase
MEKEVAQKIGDFWSEESGRESPAKINWWEFPIIHKHINQLVCGESVDGISRGLNLRLKALGITFEHGVSVGFGDGHKEFELLKEGLVKKFTLFELSDKGIESARKKAKMLGFENRVEFINGDCFQYEFSEKVDFVHWNNSLHHMLDVDKAVAWSHQILEIGGVFYMDDYVGPVQFQWSDETIELGTRIKKILPDKYLKNPYKPDELLDRTVLRPDAKILEESDPSEAADSSQIFESVIKYFPNADITLTGGSVYAGTLNTILHNIDESDLKDKTILNLLLIIDELATKSGIESLYAAVLGIKSPDILGKEVQLSKSFNRLRHTENRLKYTENQLMSAHRSIENLEKDKFALEKRLKNKIIKYQNSKSWMVTSPLRKLGRILKNLRN